MNITKGYEQLDVQVWATCANRRRPSQLLMDCSSIESFYGKECKQLTEGHSQNFENVCRKVDFNTEINGKPLLHNDQRASLVA